MATIAAALLLLFTTTVAMTTAIQPLLTSPISQTPLPPSSPMHNNNNPFSVSHSDRTSTATDGKHWMATSVSDSNPDNLISPTSKKTDTAHGVVSDIKSSTEKRKRKAITDSRYSRRPKKHIIGLNSSTVTDWADNKPPQNNMPGKRLQPMKTLLFSKMTNASGSSKPNRSSYLMSKLLMPLRPDDKFVFTVKFKETERMKMSTSSITGRVRADVTIATPTTTTPSDGSLSRKDKITVGVVLGVSILVLMCIAVVCGWNGKLELFLELLAGLLCFCLDG